MKKIILLICFALFSYVSFSQCPPNSIERTSVSSSSDGYEHIITNLYTDEYVTFSGILNSDEYKIESIHLNGIHDYITVTDASNVTIDYGMSPLILNAINSTTIRVHIRANMACDTNIPSHTLTFVDLTAASTTCQKPTVDPKTTLIYRSDTKMEIIWYAPKYSTPEGYEWMFVPQGGGTSFSGSTVAPTTSIITGDVLTPNTTYDISIRSTCGVNGNSAYTIFSIKTNAIPPPENDLCGDAITLNEQTSIPDVGSATSTDGTLSGGAGTDVAAEVCGSDPEPGNARDDVWYKFVAKTNDVHINVEPNPVFDAVLTLYSGNCGSLSYLTCSDSNNNGSEEIYQTGLTIGNTYYVRTYFYGTTTPSIPTFGIKIWSTTAATDLDNDGYVASIDCDDNDPNEFPGQIWYLDSDGDGYSNGTSTNACERPTNHYIATELTQTEGDCNDADPNINPDTVWYLDSDGDNFAVSTLTQCISPGAGYTMTILPLTDCDDSDSNEFPNQTWYLDADADGYGVGTLTIACERPLNYYTATEITSTTGDCDDAMAGVNPGETEIEGNGLDDDCNPSTPDMPLGIDDFDLNEIRIVPNPFNEKLTIYLPSGYGNDKFDAYLYDINGRVILEISSEIENDTLKIGNLNNLQQGLYFIKISSKSDGKSTVRQLVKY